MSHPYDPNNCDEFFAAEYGGIHKHGHGSGGRPGGGARGPVGVGGSVGGWVCGAPRGNRSAVDNCFCLHCSIYTGRVRNRG